MTTEQIKEFTERMRKASAIRDTETSHDEMDGILCEIAEAAGCTEAVEIFQKRERYYS